MSFLLYTIHIVVSLFLILVVLLQQGKGADLSVFGGGGTMTAFGARGAASVLHKLTVGGFVVFIITTLAIGVYQSGGLSDGVLGALPEVDESAETTTDSGLSGVLPEAESFSGGDEATEGDGTEATEGDSAAGESTTDDASGTDAPAGEAPAADAPTGDEAAPDTAAADTNESGN